MERASDIKWLVSLSLIKAMDRMLPSPRPNNRTALQFLPDDPTLSALQAAAQECRGCDLYSHATQTVFGEGHSSSKIMLIGEQPGDSEDLQGRPFVGPAGHLLDKCLHEAGIERSQVYVTNIVKHFKWEPRGKRRIHKRPNSAEVEACKPWLDAEVAAVQPKIMICLGATAAQSLLGRTFRITKGRGRRIDIPGFPPLLATAHPSSILRSTNRSERDSATKLLVADLKTALKIVAG